MTDSESYARALIEEVAASYGLTVEQVTAEQERTLYTLAAARLAETASDEPARARALAEVDAALDRFRRGA